MPKKIQVFETAFDTYTSVRVIGEGGAGRVHEVRNLAGEAMALKVLTEDRVTSERLKRFKNEIEFCQRQHHPCIVQVIDTGVSIAGPVKCPFYVMKLYAGTLRSRMRSLQTNEILPLFSQILDGVEAAHLARVWHRDLKPENILWDTTNGQLVVADFGIAHFEEEQIYTAVETKVAARMANFQYSAPEQRTRGAPADYRADIFALGLLLNEMFTGAVPHGVGYKKIADVDLAHAYLDELVDQMVQHDPNKRPSSIEAIKKELIGRKAKFVALQKLDALSKQVIPASTPAQFEPIVISDLDYANGVLRLKLSKNTTPDWISEFRAPRGGYSFIPGYGPEQFEFRGNFMSIKIHNSQNFIQEVVNNAKLYVDAANRGYVELMREQSIRHERLERAELERLTAEAQLRKDILANIRL